MTASHPASLEPWTVRQRLAYSASFYRLILLDRIGSTNDVAWQAAVRSLPEGIVVVAEEQTAGRGRLGRQWHAPKGTNLLLSVLMRPNLPADQAIILTALAACSCVAALETTTGIRPELKWPNDLLVGRRKVGGILIETSLSDRVDHAVVGVGINLNWHPAALGPDAMPATSIHAETGGWVDRTRVIVSLLTEMYRRYELLLAGEKGRLWREWRSRLIEFGREVRVRDETGVWDGLVRDVSSAGELVVVDEAGHERSLAYGEATIRLR